VLGLWGGAALLLRPASDGPLPARDLARYAVPLIAYAILVASGLAGQIAWTGAALAPVALLLLAGLLAYTAGRRAGLIQGLSERVAIGMGTTLALSAPIMLSTGLQAVGMVLGLVGGLVLANLAPPPPVVARPYLSALLAVQHQLLFVAPLTVVLLWLVRTFL
jgi:hypothetical protein